MSEVITNNLDLWTSALLTKSSAGRGGNGKQEAYGVKKLRELILELALRGKLVPQGPNDEPASELLKKIAAEKKRLIKDGLIRASKPPAFPLESPEHELPANWVWTNLHEIGEISSRNDSGDKVEASFVPMQAISEKYGEPVQHEVKPWGEIKSGFTHFREEDVVLAKITPCFQNGKSAVMRGLTNGFGAGTTELHVYRSINGGTVPEYVLIYLKSPRFIGDGIPKMTGTAGQKRITRDYFAGNHFPLPPLAEQHRIVAKVDELMALCDQLEQQQTHSLEAHQTLVETLLGTLTRAASHQELTEAWTRIADHFDTLFTTEHSIDQLKQTILQLSVMGKLVPQDPSDEPASVLLQKIAAEKSRLVKDGRIGKSKPLPPVTDEEKKFDIADSWVWTRFDSLALHSEAGWSPSCESAPRQGEKWGVLKVSAVTWGKYDPQENKALPGNLEPRPELEVMPGDFLISRANTADLVARAVVVPNGAPPRLMMSDKIIRFAFSSELNHEYLALINGSEFSREYYARVAGGTSSSMKNVSREQIRNLVVALPPLAEQRRIVAKFDELMALCDALEARIKDAQATQIHLADAIVEQAVA